MKSPNKIKRSTFIEMAEKAARKSLHAQQTREDEAVLWAIGKLSKLKAVKQDQAATIDELVGAIHNLLTGSDPDCVPEWVLDKMEY